MSLLLPSGRNPFPEKTRNPIYDLSKADVIVSLDADFLFEGPANLILTKAFSKKRRDPAADFNRLYVVESAPSITGAKADVRWQRKPSEIDRLRATARGRTICRALRQDRPRSGNSRTIFSSIAAEAWSWPAIISLKSSTPWPFNLIRRWEILARRSRIRRPRSSHSDDSVAGFRCRPEARGSQHASHCRCQSHLRSSSRLGILRRRWPGLLIRSISDSTTTKPVRAATGMCPNPIISRRGATSSPSMERRASFSRVIEPLYPDVASLMEVISLFVDLPPQKGLRHRPRFLAAKSGCRRSRALGTLPQ